MFRHSQDGELAVGVSLDNRLRLYDATTGAIRQKYVEKDHLAFRYTCLDWLRGLAWNDKHPNKVVPGPKGGLGLLALGTDQGHVSLWDLTRGVLAARLGEGQNLKSITGLAFSPDGSKIYTASEGAAEVLEWDLKTQAVGRRITGDKHGASALALGPDGNGGAGLLAVARTRIHLVDAASGERVKKISAGHAASIRCLAFSPDGRFLASAAEGSRYVNIFDCGGGKGGKGALATLALDGVPRQLSLRAEEGGAFTVLAVCDDGTVRILRHAPQHGEAEAPAMNGDGPAAPAAAGQTATLRVVKKGGGGKKQKKAADAPGLAACLLPGGGGGGGQGAGGWRCALIHGTDAAPLFERFMYATGAGLEALLPQVAVAGLGEEEEELGAGEEKGGQKRKRGEGTQAVGVEDPASKKAAVDGSMGAEQRKEKEASQRTIGSRLGEMAAAAAAASAAAFEAGAGAGAGGKRGAAPKADSLVTVLTQALKSGDEELLEQCLLVHDAAVVSNTVQLLPPQLTLALVETLVRKLEKRPNRAATICPWVRFLLLHHTSYLVSVPSLHKRLAGLHQLATRRVAALPRLLGLAGRLELMLSQISKQGDHRQQGEEGDGDEVDVYDDNEESEASDAEEGEESGEGSEEEVEGLAGKEEEESDEGDGMDDGMEDEEESEEDED